MEESDTTVFIELDKLEQLTKESQQNTVLKSQIEALYAECNNLKETCKNQEEQVTSKYQQKIQELTKVETSRMKVS